MPADSQQPERQPPTANSGPIKRIKSSAERPSLRPAWARFWVLAPWLAAAGYLSLLAQLGLLFSEIDHQKLTGLVEATATPYADPVKNLIRIAPEGPVTVSLSTEFLTPSDGQPLVLFVPRSGSDLAVYLNEFNVRRIPATYRQRNDYRPLLVHLTEDQLSPAGQQNRLQLDLVSYSGIQVLSESYLGPESELLPVYRAFFFFRQDFPRIALGITLLLGSAMLIIWGIRRRLSQYGWLGLSFVAFSYYLYSLISTDEPTNVALYTWSFLLARAVFIVSFLVFAHRFLKLRRPALERLAGGSFLVVFGAGLVPALSGDYDSVMRLTLVTSLPLVLGLIVYLAVLFIRQLRQSGDVYLHWLAVGALMGVALGVYDVLVLADWHHPLILDFFVSHYAIIFSCIGAGAVLVHQLARALLDSEDLNNVLNQELAVRSKALETNAELRLAQEKRLALAQERQRIMADVHDGVGGQLVSLMAAHRAGGLAPAAVDEELSRIFADLRLVLDALTPSGEDLILAMARLRDRLNGLLVAAGVKLDWEISDELAAVPLRPGQTVNALRLVQESVQNAIKHGQAHRISVSLRPKGEALELSISDNGCGYDPDHTREGHGQTTLRRRAEAVGGTLNVASSPGRGCTVSLCFPSTGDTA